MNRTLIAFFVVGSLLVSANAVEASSAVTTCAVNQKFYCEKGKACISIKNNIVIRVDYLKRVYSRCDTKGCDDYKALIGKSGTFTNIFIPNRGALAKVSMLDHSFLEVVTLGTNAYVSHGICRTSR